MRTYTHLNIQCLDYIQPSPYTQYTNTNTLCTYQGATHNMQMNVQMCAYWQPRADTDTLTLYTHIVSHCVTHKRRPQREVNTQRGGVLPQCVCSLDGEEELQREKGERVQIQTHTHMHPHPLIHAHIHIHIPMHEYKNVNCMHRYACMDVRTHTHI